MQSGEFEEFYDRALPVVFGYFVTRCGGRKDLAEELTQETFLSAVQSIDDGASVEAQLPWIVSIARRRLVDYYRKQERLERNDRAAGLSTYSRPEGGTTRPTTVAEARLMTALDRVAATHRLALTLRYVDDLPVKEVARLMGRSEAAAESLIRRSRQSLLEAYKEIDIE